MSSIGKSPKSNKEAVRYIIRDVSREQLKEIRALVNKIIIGRELVQI